MKCGGSCRLWAMKFTKAELKNESKEDKQNQEAKKKRKKKAKRREKIPEKHVVAERI